MRRNKNSFSFFLRHKNARENVIKELMNCPCKYLKNRISDIRLFPIKLLNKSRAVLFRILSDVFLNIAEQYSFSELKLISVIRSVRQKVKYHS